MTRIACIAFCLFAFSLKTEAQANLVVNPSFEDTVSCPNNIAEINRANGWQSFSGSPDYYNFCASISSQASVPYNAVGYQQAATGNAYAGFIAFGSVLPDLREFIGGTLSSPLVIGTKYYLSFKVSLSIKPSWSTDCACNNLGALFSTVTYGPCNGCLPVPKNPQINSTIKITDSLNWTRISGAFIADSAYKYIIIGNFFTNANTDTLIMDGASKCTYYAYYYLDDVCVSTDSLTCNGGVGIENYFTQREHVKIFPNPASDQTTCEVFLKANEKGSAQLYNMFGDLITEEKLKTGLNSTKFDLSNVRAGIYLCKIIVNGQIKEVRKLIIGK